MGLNNIETSKLMPIEGENNYYPRRKEKTKAMFAKDIMTADVITITPNAEIYELTKTLAEQKVSGLPVCDNMGQVVGVVSEGDLNNLKNGSRVKDIMCRKVIGVASDMPVQKVAAVLDRYKIKRVPVYDNGNIVGIISRADIVAAMAKSHMPDEQQLH